MEIRKADLRDARTLGVLAAQLWPDNKPEELALDFSENLAKKDAACFLVFSEGLAVGFAQCQLRYDYVEGTESSPVGYLEGIYVAESCRRRGLAGALLKACENWTKEKGCREFASDCELDNADSLNFHMSLGFEEKNRIICFAKSL